MAGKISGKEFVKDIRDGMNRKALATKYGVSPRRLEAMFDKVVEAGILKKSALPGATPGGPGEEVLGLQMADSPPPVVDNTPPAIDNAPPPPGSHAPAQGHSVESVKESPSQGKSKGLPPGIGDIIGGAVLICIGLAMGGSVFTGDADIVDWFFDILGTFWICRGVYRMIKR